jgi:hypothetical protein
LPHHHVDATCDDPELKIVSTDGARHACLACSIHAPAMDLSEETSGDVGSTDASTATECAPPILGTPILGDASPRGPPVIV